MTAPDASDFAPFFRAVHGFDPFPWQRRLVEELLGNGGAWPDRLSLPTASGKTSCVDIAVFLLACDAAKPVDERKAPRRIFFVVDRRVIVDQTLDHAEKLADALVSSAHGPVSRVAQALLKIGSEPGRPLDVYALRGGMYRESAWVRSPLQPTVITTTVDQIGSRLLFRGYGVSELAHPVHAALTAIDSLVILDEAHVSRPFERTVARVVARAAECPQRTGNPVRLVSMSATPRPGTAAERVFQLDDQDRQHPVLGPRLTESKPARLREIASKGSSRQSPYKPLIEAAVNEALGMLGAGRARLGVIVNRVATARAIAEELRGHKASDGDRPYAEVVLLTGRMRPVDRDGVSDRIDRVRSRPEGTNPAQDGAPKPIVVVATQTIEVGADLDFDALITECASLDALRQRFGRLNRLGRWPLTDSVVLARAPDVKPNATDPIYGQSLGATWDWLKANADVSAEHGSGTIDMSADSISARLDGLEPATRVALSPPQADAATLLPPHLDLLGQTSPPPATDPDVHPFLRGLTIASPELSVVFRADLGDDSDAWASIVALCPPTTAEALPVRLPEFRRWLMGHDAADRACGDVEGEAAPPSQDDQPVANGPTRRALAWHAGRVDDPPVITHENLDRLRPAMVLVVPAHTEEERSSAQLLGDLPAAGTQTLDVGDHAACIARDRLVLRLRPELYPQLPQDTALDPLTADPDDLYAMIESALQAITPVVVARHDTKRQTKIENNLLTLARDPEGRRVEPHPLGGVVVSSRARLRLFDPTDTDDETRSRVSHAGEHKLLDHSLCVRDLAHRFASAVPLDDSIRECIRLAALFHDAGKADPRFQALLLAASPIPPDPNAPLAKSARSHRRHHQDRSGWPKGERHEFYSVRMVERAIGERSHPALAALTHAQADLLLHLIAAHHGHARPFAPVVIDTNAHPAPPFNVTIDGHRLSFEPALPHTQPQPHPLGHGLERLDSGVAERFWRLTRRYGWWGLAYLETLVRLADWKASEPPANPPAQEATT